MAYQGGIKFYPDRHFRKIQAEGWIPVGDTFPSYYTAHISLELIYINDSCSKYNVVSRECGAFAEFVVSGMQEKTSTSDNEL